MKSLKYFGYKVINTEYNLTVKVGKYFFSGRLDSLLKDGDMYYILDYKTGTIPKNPKYDFQTMIYILAVSKFYNTENVTFVYLDLKNQNEARIDYSYELSKEYEEKLMSTGEKIEHIEKTGRQNQNCKCEYSTICF